MNNEHDARFDFDVILVVSIMTDAEKTILVSSNKHRINHFSLNNSPPFAFYIERELHSASSSIERELAFKNNDFFSNESEINEVILERYSGE